MEQLCPAIGSWTASLVPEAPIRCQPFVNTAAIRQTLYLLLFFYKKSESFLAYAVVET